MGAPLIGIAGEESLVSKPWGGQRRTTAPMLVVEGVAAAGGAPVVLPPGAKSDHLLHLDGLVLTGGVDLGVDPDRDLAEEALVPLARSLGLPLLGICRGLQVMAVATGGSLVEELGQAHVLAPPGRTHPLLVQPGSVAAGLVPDRRVGSLHHQSVATYARGWRCTGAAPDGVVESLEWHDQQAWPALGVQWHPELDHTGPAVFGWLVEVARRPKSERSLPGTGVRERAASQRRPREQPRPDLDPAAPGPHQVGQGLGRDTGIDACTDSHRPAFGAAAVTAKLTRSVTDALMPNRHRSPAA